MLAICHFHILETIPIQDDIWHRISTEQNYHFPLLCNDLVNKFVGTHEVTSTKNIYGKRKRKGKIYDFLGVAGGKNQQMT